MFLTQFHGTMLGAFINYAIMRSILAENRNLLINCNGNSAWSGPSLQAYNTNVASWALAPYLYKSGAPYSAVPIAISIGAGAVVLHRLFQQDSNPQGDPFISWCTMAVKPNPNLNLVCPQDWMVRNRRDQLAAVYCIHGCDSLQFISNLRYFQPTSRWLLRPVLSTKLQAAHVQRILIHGYGGI